MARFGKRSMLLIWSLLCSAARPPALTSLEASSLHPGVDLGPGGCPSDTEAPCSGHGRCAGGLCSCDRGFEGAGCARRGYLFSCPLNCSYPAGHCDSTGRCVCARGRSGDGCEDVTPVNCSASCAGPPGGPLHGECVGGTCVCRPGFRGPSCERGCPGYVRSTAQDCGGRGLCQAAPRAATRASGGVPGSTAEVPALDHCKCFQGFSGDACERDLLGALGCDRDCSGHGSCVAGACRCHHGHGGRDCSILLVHGDSHWLDSPTDRLAVAALTFLATGCLAWIALRYVQRGPPGWPGKPIALADVSHETKELK